MIFCAAGDPGGSRALLPVIEDLEKRGLVCRVLDHGYLGRELPLALGARLVSADQAAAALASSRCFLFGSSSTDTRPLALARQAREMGRPVVHVLDNWTNYARRLNHDGGPLLVPDIYAVMDEEAGRGAVAEGLPESCIKVTGHPGLAVLDAYVQRRRHCSLSEERRKLGLPEDGRILAFINEPLRQVLGADLAAPGHYGFTEDQVLADWAEALAFGADDAYAVILPHPKDDPDELALLWRRIGRGLKGRVLRLPEGRAILTVADALAGMASILLYDAWICGLPTLSMQPGVRAEPIRRFARLPGLFYADAPEDVPRAVEGWLGAAGQGLSLEPRPELKAHLGAAGTVARLIEELMEEGK